MLKIFMKVGYHLHRYLQGYNEVLSNDALCEELKSKFRSKAIYHGHKAKSLLSRF
ncbi:hypothetical protein M670_03575 [Schinkia azotoformans MEV2011]|uniref:Uncharacterized protein n=1 Tax=Schinkia azotoformans MEV2011 TaxID=1348973 RepID=A0A072NHJ8_SCHAZ|nr:hypothetical protein M670_03575 [Schinkia azotoformans MEV2011]